MSHKKYISLGAMPLSVDVMDNGILRTFDFRGGLRHPKFVAPFFITSDKKEQDLLEGSVTYGKSFILESEEITKPESVQSASEVPFISDASETSLLFKTVQAAKDWIYEKYEIHQSKFPNRNKVVEFLAEKGITVKFETDNKQ